MKKRILSFALVLCMVLTLMPMSAFAADYPTAITSDGTELTSVFYTVQGNAAEVYFICNHVFKNEKIVWDVYKGGVNGTIIASNSHSMYPSESWSKEKILIGTVGYDAGTYTIKYHVSFYTNYEWKDGPSEGTLFLVVCDGHTFGSSEITTDATCTEEGKSCRTCTKCGYKEYSTVPEKGHNYNENGECIRCGDIMALSGVCDDNISWSLIGSTLTISGTGSLISEPWSSYKSYIKSVIIESGVTSIGSSVFYCCRNIKSIIIPDGVMSIGANAFAGCNSLETVTIPDSVTRIGKAAFEGCNSPKDVYYYGNVESWLKITFSDYVSNPCNNGANLYFNGELVTAVDIPDSITSIGDSAFSGCCSLTSVTIPDSVTSIGSYAFRDCSNLTSITIGDGVTSIGDSAFSGCSSLSSVAIPDSVTSIGNWALYDCCNLTSVTIPDSVTSIGEYAFSSCNSLASVTIPEGITSIGYRAFSGCYNLKEVYYNGNIEAWLKIKSSSLESNPCNNGANLYFNGELVTAVDIPDSITSIGDNAFSGCCSLTSVTIPDSVTSIGSCAFRDCSNLTSITIGDGVTNIEFVAFFNTAYYNDASNWENGVLYIGNCLIEAKQDIESCEIKDGIRLIADDAFYECYDLTSVTSPDSVTSIGDWAFYGCYDLTDVYYSGSKAQWQEISIGYDNDCLTSATIHYESVPVHTHSYTSVVTAPTCTEQGYTTYTCSTCGESYVDNYTDALGHDYGDWTVTKAATETEKGVETRYCSRCDATETRDIVPIGHTHSYTTAVTAPTCTNEGFTTYTCTCGDSYVADYVAALGHNYVDGKCTVCGAADPDYKPTPVVNPFTDVSETAVYYDAILWAVENKITTGYADNTFRPAANCTRGQVVTFLWRAAGQPEPKGTCPFTDVSSTSPYYKAIIWAAEQGITTGYSDGTFRPNATVTRAQFVTFLWRYEKEPAAKGTINFADASTIAKPYQEAVAWAVGAGVTTGYNDNTFRPNATCTRWAVVLFMYRDLA